MFLETNDFEGTPLSNFEIIFKITLSLIGFYVFLVLVSVFLRMKKHLIDKKSNFNNDAHIKNDNILNSSVKKGNKNYKVSLIKKNDSYAIEDLKIEKGINLSILYRKLKDKTFLYLKKFYIKCIKNPSIFLNDKLIVLIKRGKTIYRKVFNYIKKQVPYIVKFFKENTDKVVKSFKKNKIK